MLKAGTMMSGDFITATREHRDLYKHLVTIITRVPMLWRG